MRYIIRTIGIFVVAMLVTSFVYGSEESRVEAGASLYSGTMVDVDMVTVIWRGSKVIGGGHDGEVNVKDATINVVDGVLKSGVFIVDMGSITCGDITNKSSNKMLVDHLKSDDFFGVKEYPTAKIEIVEVVNGVAKGDITIKGVTKSVTFGLVHNDGSYHAKLELDRTDFGIQYKSSSFFDNLKDKAISDLFTIEVTLEEM